MSAPDGRQVEKLGMALFADKVRKSHGLLRQSLSSPKIPPLGYISKTRVKRVSTNLVGTRAFMETLFNNQISEVK